MDNCSCRQIFYRTVPSGMDFLKILLSQGINFREYYSVSEKDAPIVGIGLITLAINKRKYLTEKNSFHGLL